MSYSYWLRVLLAGVMTGCAAPATIYRTDGPRLDAVIDRSDAENLYVRSDQGTSLSLGQGQVKEIDHPGNVAVVGGVAMLVAGLLVWRAANEADREGGAAPLTVGMGRLFGILFTFGGAFSTVNGTVVWTRSRQAARPFNRARADR